MKTNPSFNTFCRWFPTLDRHFGAGPAITAVDLVQYLKSAAPTGGSRAAAQFCLAVWNSRDYSFGVIDVGCWDREHCAAFARWAVDPFWY